MKKLKLVISDLHLGLGRTLEGGNLNLLEEFFFDEKFLEFLHFYTNGKYEESEIELVLNGDILNFLQVDYNGHYLSVITEQVSLEKTKRIVKGHPKFFKGLKDFLSKPNRSLTYVVGNHDQDVLWPAVRAYLNEILDTHIRFKNIVYFVDGIHIEHGHMHEAANRVNPKKFFVKKNIPEPILNIPFGSHFFVDLVLKIKHEYPHVDKIRPFDRMLRWSLYYETIKTLKWTYELIKYFFQTLFTENKHKPWKLRTLIQIVLESAVFPDLSSAAKKILQNERVNIVIFGHTHVYEYRQWDDCKEYFNTGTWTDLTSLDIASLGKITKLTYVLIEYPDDGESAPKARLKEWRGYHRIEEDIAI